MGSRAVGLDVLQGVAESTMTDTCVITRDSEGTADDTFDPVTLSLTRPVGEPSTVYTGKCLVYQAGVRQALDTEGERTYTEKEYVGAVPMDAAQPRVGDGLTVTVSADPWLVNRPFVVVAVEGSTFAVSREMRLEERSG